MSTSPRLLIVDDHPALLRALEDYLLDQGYQVATAPSGETALERLGTEPVDLVLLDLVTPGLPGMEVLTRIKARHDVPVLVMTGFAEASSALEAIGRGAYEFLTKPVAPEMLPALIRNALDHHRLARKEANQKDGGAALSYGGLLGRSRAMLQVFQTIEDVAQTEAAVLLTGETGTGKNMIAREIQARSPRARGPFVEVNCAALPAPLFEAEMFGHERGAYTGADARRPGRFERAHGGTIFLDEIASLPLELQGKLLRVLQDRKFERVGGSETLSVDVRVIAATNGNLQAMANEGKFRPDLYYRLCIVPIAVPALRDRRDDIPLLLVRFLSDFCRAHQRDVPAIDPKALDEALRYDWPGNVRELANAVERTVIRSRSPRIESFLKEPEATEGPSASHPPRPGSEEGTFPCLHDAQARFQRTYFLDLLGKVDGSLDEAARIAGVDVRTLHRYLRKLQISPKEVRRRNTELRDEVQAVGTVRDPEGA